MNKVMIRLFLPANGSCYDVLLPRTLSVGQATELLKSFFSGTEGGAYLPDEDAVLCNMEDGKMYSPSLSVEELHLTPGARLMMI